MSKTSKSASRIFLLKTALFNLYIHVWDGKQFQTLAPKRVKELHWWVSLEYLMWNLSEEEALVLYEWTDLDLMKLSRIVVGARLFDISYIKFDTDSKKSICMGNIFKEIKKGIAWVVGFKKYIIRITCFFYVTAKQAAHAVWLKRSEVAIKCVICCTDKWNCFRSVNSSVFTDNMTGGANGMTSVVSCKNQNSSYRGKFRSRETKFSSS